MRILFITANRIGDAVLSTGLLGWLETQYPAAAFTIVCGPVAADLFCAVPRLEQLIVMKKRKYNGHWLALWLACIGTEWDLVVDLRNSIVSRLLRAKRRAYRPARKTGQHVVIDNAATFALNPPPAPTLWLDRAAQSAAVRFVPPGTPILALGPAANWPAKQWPLEYFMELAQHLTADNGPLPQARILIVTAPHERPQVEALLAAFPPAQIIDLIGQDLLTVAACLQQCRLFIGNDSGLMHIAAAMRIPTLGLFGPGYEKIYGPWGTRCAYVRTPESAAELLAKLPYPGARHPNLMASLSVTEVYAAAATLLAQTAESRV